MLASKATIFFHSDDSHAFPFVLVLELKTVMRNFSTLAHGLFEARRSDFVYKIYLSLCHRTACEFGQKFPFVGIFWEALGWSGISYL